jgi:hypothetical protein
MGDSSGYSLASGKINAKHASLTEAVASKQVAAVRLGIRPMANRCVLVRPGSIANLTPVQSIPRGD